MRARKVSVTERPDGRLNVYVAALPGGKPLKSTASNKADARDMVEDFLAGIAPRVRETIFSTSRGLWDTSISSTDIPTKRYLETNSFSYHFYCINPYPPTSGVAPLDVSSTNLQPAPRGAFKPVNQRPHTLGGSLVRSIHSLPVTHQ